MKNKIQESIITKAKFAKKYSVNRSLITRAAKDRKLDLIIDNGKEKILLSGNKTQRFIIDLSYSDQAGTISQVQSITAVNKEYADIVGQLKREQLRHKISITTSTELKNAYIRGDLLRRDLVYSEIMYYIDRIFSNVKRNSRAFVSDNSNKIAKLIIDGHDITTVLDSWDSLQDSTLADAQETFLQKIANIEKIQAADF